MINTNKSRIRKIATKQEIIFEAHDILREIDKLPQSEIASFNLKYSFIWEEWNGKWKDTSHCIENDEFEVYSTRKKHTNGRIRDSYNTVTNGLGFIMFCIENFPNRKRSQIWAERIKNSKLVLNTLDTGLRKFFHMPSDIANIRSEIKAAQCLCNLHAQR